MPRQLPPPEVHEEERQVVEHVDARNLVVELNGVEEGRAAVEQDDVPKVKVAVALPDKSSVASRVELCAIALNGISGVLREAGARGLIQDSSTLFDESCRVSVVDPGHPGLPAMVRTPLGSQMKLRDRRCQRAHQTEIQCAPARESIEESILIEAGHFDEPVDWWAGSAQRERSVRFTCDRHDAAIQVGSSATVDPHFGFAHRLPSLDGGEVQIVVQNRALELQGPRAGEKHD